MIRRSCCALEVDRARDVQHLRRRHGRAEQVVGEHVGEADDRRFALGVGGMVRLDHLRDHPWQTPTPGDHAADERMVDAELAPFALDPLLRRARVAVHLLRVPGIRVDQHELAEVVQQRRDHQSVARLVVDLVQRSARRRAGSRRRAAGSAPGCSARRRCARRSHRCARGWRSRGPCSATAPRPPGRRCPPRPRPAPSTWLASRITEIASARSPSIARIRSLVGGSPPSNRRSTRLRDSASTGNASSASNAAVSRRPWPSLWWRSREAYGSVGRCARGCDCGHLLDFVRFDRSTWRDPATHVTIGKCSRTI